MAESGATQPLSFEMAIEIVYIAELSDNTRLIRCNIKYFESQVLSLRPQNEHALKHTELKAQVVGGKTAGVPVVVLLISTI